MFESTYWYFERFGDATSVMRKGRQSLPQPRPDEAVVAVRAIGLNQAENRYLRGSHFPPQRFPACLSHEAVGEIVALGPTSGDKQQAVRWRVGDRVGFVPMLVDTAGMGVLRDIGVYDQSALIPVPEAYSDREGAAYWMGFLTMAGAMEMAGLGPEACQARMIAFTAASGGMGTLGIKLARAWGAETIALTRSQEKLERLSGLASHAAVVGAAGELAKALRKWRPDGVDAVIDPLGGDYVAAAVEALAPGGRYVSYEWLAGTTARYDITTLMVQDASLHGFTVFRLLRYPGLLQRLVRLGMEYAHQLTPVLASNYRFDVAPEAFEAMARSAHFGKITITL